MRTQIRKYLGDFVAVIALALIALGVGGYILSNQRFYLPKQVPIFGSDFVDYKAEFSTAQSVMPGQGQSVNVAGVPVGEISKVELDEGRAVVTMKIRRKYTPIYKDASALLRPKTGLNDMMVELTPGTDGAGELDPDSQRIPVQQTLPNVNADEILAALDGDTRDYLKLLLNGAGEALGGNGKNLSATFRRFEPTSRDLLEMTELLAERRQNIKRSISNFRKLTEAIGTKDEELTQLIDASNAVFKSFANQDQNIRALLRELPGTLEETNTTLAKVDDLGDVLGPSLGQLRPAARALGPSLRQTRPFLRETIEPIREQIRPFTRDARPVVKDLRPAARDLADLTPDLRRTMSVLNYLLNTLAYNPPGDEEEGYMFWQSWLNHLGPTLFDTQDAHGPIRRGTIFVSCSTATAISVIREDVNPQLRTIFDLVNLPSRAEACAESAQAPGTTAPAPAAPAAPATPEVPAAPEIPALTPTARSGK